LRTQNAKNYTTFKDLSDKSFWEQFYSSHLPNKSFDWFLGFDDVKEYLGRYLPPIENRRLPRILDLGCGTSNFSIEMFRHLKGECYIDCVDYSETAIKIMKQRVELLKNEGETLFTGNGVISFYLADVRSLPFHDEIFKLSIDKGTSDAVLRSANGEEEFVKSMAEVVRVLQGGGTIVQFSDEAPESRMDLIGKVSQRVSKFKPSCSLNVLYKELGSYKAIEYFMYVLQKE
jgi:ubiquinone/menaquinone biosynthesis C-methylase UbiE